MRIAASLCAALVLSLFHVSEALACGNPGEAVCAPPPKCVAQATQNPVDPSRCIACGGVGQVPCEPTTNNTVRVPTQTTGGPVWGWADVHTHMFANEAYGGAVIWGKPFDPNGVKRALAQCDYTWDFVTEPSWVIDGVSLFAGPLFSLSNGSLAFDASHAWYTGGYPVHGTNWVTWHALIPTQTLFGLPVTMATGNIDHTLVDLTSPAGVYNLVTTGTGMHHTAGMPDFYPGTEASHGWPHFLDGGHQQMYHKWVERAYQAGLRLLIDMPVNNDVLCSISIKRTT